MILLLILGFQIGRKNLYRTFLRIFWDSLYLYNSS